MPLGSRGGASGFLRASADAPINRASQSREPRRMGIWSAVNQVWPQTRQQRCWNHKVLNVVNQIHKRQQVQARALLVQIPYANTLTDAGKLRKKFIARYQSQFPKAVKALDRDWDRMLTFFDFPTEHWRHLKTTNVVESPFASVRLRTNAAKRYKKIVAASALIWRTLMVAEKRFRRLNAPHLLKDVYVAAWIVARNGRSGETVRGRRASRPL